MDGIAEPSLQAAPLPAPSVGGPAAPLPVPCGWWESSLELRSGLCVVEHAGFEPLGDTALPLWQLQ